MSTTGEARVKESRRAPRILSDRLLGSVGVGMMVLAAVMLIRGGETDGGARPVAGPPAIELLHPLPGASVAGPLAVLFRLDGELVRQPSGWGVDGLHLHLQLDALELMPAAADVEAVPGGAFRWTVGRLEPGPHDVRLFWSDAAHRPVEGGESRTVEIEVL